MYFLSIHPNNIICEHALIMTFRKIGWYQTTSML